MNMNFHDDPRPLLTELDKAWAHYTRDFDALMKQVLSSIVSWRWATGDMFPSHPLFGQADTTTQAEPWRPFYRNWLRDDDPKANLADGWQHGFDSQGRIVLARNQHWGQATVWRDGGCDRLDIHESKEEAGRFIWGLPYDDRVEFSRFWHNKDGRIECMCSYLREDDVHYRTFEWFDFEGKRCVESIQQSFEIMPEIPDYEDDKSEDELRADYRPLQGDELINNLVETMFSRRRVKYSYSPTGELLKAEEFRADGKPLDELLFEKLPERSLEETIDALVDKTAGAIEKAVRKRSTAKPYRGLILIYSAEHAHCGLPHQVSVLGHETPWPKDRYYHEDYPVQLEVEYKRPVWSLLTEFNQRCHARFAMDEFDAQTATAVAVMQTIAEQLHHAFAGTKHVTDDFAVLVIDDHGDVDSFAVPT
jgi:hypothetical protein